MTVLLKRIAGAESGPNGPYLTTVRCNNTDTVDAQKVILKPGDILFTGTPAGVGNIKKGDTLEASIDEVGALKLNFE